MRAAVAAAPTRVAQPGNPDPVTWLEALYTSTDCRDPSDDFMARDQRQMRMRQFTVHDMKISATDAAGPTSISTCPLPGVRSGNWQCTSGSPARCNTIAYMRIALAVNPPRRMPGAGTDLGNTKTDALASGGY